MTSVIDIAKNASFAATQALQLSTEIKNNALLKIADLLEQNKDKIVKANIIDLENAKDLSMSMVNRLKLDDNKIRDMIQGVRDISLLPDPINKEIWSKDIAENMTLKKVSCPIGVIGVIFEARPDVISQISSLAIKSSNAVILKGGSEAVNTNKIIFELINEALSSVDGFPQNMINLIFTRDDVKQLLDADSYVNLIIPRGSNALVKYIKSNTKIPVLGHADGICHIYIDEFADINKVLDICIDAKCQYPSACNAVETILINEKVALSFMPQLMFKFIENGVEVIGDENILKIIPNVKLATDDDWKTEYGDKIVSIKVVKNIDEAINHINKYGSGHTDCIITENNENSDKFMMFVDSSGVYKNASTRFADGFRYGFGAEVGISTNKTHARGPVGLEGLTIYKYKLFGNGDIVADFASGKRQFIKS
ncbi:MAG: glutamate-5-semialdehyde dehydrogenase [Cyanobacteria bacterium SIG29]|nr:glutamate-5-semialdehyde dehydrogenase [Cyanobacteria bacterium SIG29]